MKKILTLTLCLCAALTSNAQAYLDHLQTEGQDLGSITVSESKEIDALVNGKTAVVEKAKTEKAAEKTVASKPKDKAEKNTAVPVATKKTSASEPVETETSENRKKVLANSYKVDGYRVQAFAGGNSREDKNRAQQIGNEIKALYPNQPVYVHFYSPRWICRVGNFRNYDDASDLLKEMKKLGYSEACIVKGKITVSY
ncbi:MAG: SPOR domain-containing protein [Prevotella sp.]|nr:SPOR domain-containing protein [Prevotella sp.]